MVVMVVVVGDEPNTAEVSNRSSARRSRRYFVRERDGHGLRVIMRITVATTTTRTRRTTTNYSTEMALRVQRWEMILLKAEKSTIDGG